MQGVKLCLPLMNKGLPFAQESELSSILQTYYIQI